jgi:hypothetical protein
VRPAPDAICLELIVARRGGVEHVDVRHAEVYTKAIAYFDSALASLSATDEFRNTTRELALSSFVSAKMEQRRRMRRSFHGHKPSIVRFRWQRAEKPG